MDTDKVTFYRESMGKQFDKIHDALRDLHTAVEEMEAVEGAIEAWHELDLNAVKGMRKLRMLYRIPYKGDVK